MTCVSTRADYYSNYEKIPESGTYAQTYDQRRRTAAERGRFKYMDDWD